MIQLCIHETKYDIVRNTHDDIKFKAVEVLACGPRVTRTASPKLPAPTVQGFQ